MTESRYRENEHSVSHDTDELDNPERRKLFKRAAIGGGAVLAAGIGVYGAGRMAIEGSVNKQWPILADDFKPFRGENLMFSYAASPSQMLRRPEINEQFGRLVKGNPNYNFQLQVPRFEEKGWDNSRIGFTQLDRSLSHASWLPGFKWDLRLGAFGVPQTVFYSWDQSDVEHEQYKFETQHQAANAIRSAARLFGAARCGITRRDKRWDYDPIYHAGPSKEMFEELHNRKIHKLEGQAEMAVAMQALIEEFKPVEKEMSWEKDFPFEPKSVIVMAVPMDYDNMASAPSFTSGGTVGDGYTKMATLASQMAKFIRGLGYHAVASGNDLGNNVAYAISAGLGEGSRFGSLIVPGYGPRIRLCKVYTDFEFVEYDEPHSWGIEEFCKSCKECAHACPSDAVSMDDEPTFKFAGEHSEQPGYSWSNHEGIKKFHGDSKKCFDYWLESDSDCGACIAACTFNEPDFWHHWMIVAANPFIPSVLHSAMSKMHPAFGYGATEDPTKVTKFWNTGEGMRVNPTSRNVFGAVGQS
ncbi:reductive dehalogenase [uncultured Shewanella sp.]|uniref:reductive dehalogenase n=1 Tax=uncultured Shewanella sp. TaxID=173975 RepID=UPI002616F821|nr:reductive dehalogenase [uncultured Shewanella sp.]